MGRPRKRVSPREGEEAQAEAGCSVGVVSEEENLKNPTFYLILASLTPSSNFKGVTTFETVPDFLSNHQPAAPGDNVHTKEPKKLPSVCLRHVRQARGGPETHLESVLQVNQRVESAERTVTRTTVILSQKPKPAFKKSSQVRSVNQSNISYGCY